MIVPMIHCDHPGCPARTQGVERKCWRARLTGSHCVAAPEGWQATHGEHFCPAHHEGMTNDPHSHA